MKHEPTFRKIQWLFVFKIACEQSVGDVKFPIYSGLYSPCLRTSADLEKAIRLSKEKGVREISIFTADDLKKEQETVLRSSQKDSLVMLSHTE